MLHVFLVIDGEDGTVLVANRSIEEAWLSVVRNGPVDLFLPDGEPLTVEGLRAALDESPEVPIVGTEATGMGKTLVVQCHGLNI